MLKQIYGTILVTSLFLAACAPPPEPETQELNFGTQNNQQTNQATQPTNPPANQQKTDLFAKPKGSMKTLQDFETIAAKQATITTTKGAITIELYREQAPVTTANFLSLAKSGFYNDIVFHRVIEDFMAQVGDPLTKDAGKKAMWGTGGPGYTIPDEFGTGLTHDSEGIVSMANSGPNTGGSQFFITFGPTTWLDGKHAIFGKVTQGLDVLKQIEQGDKIVSISYQ